MNKDKKKTSKVRIYVDIFFFILMILVLVPQSTGIPIHEWASFIILIPFLIHLIINWNWIATNSTKFFKRKPNKTRFDYILNWLLYLIMILVTISGIVISESALPLFGIHFEPDGFWSQIHNISATLFMVILGIHLALHWKWIVGAFGKLKLKTDLHHLTEIKSILAKHLPQLLLITVVSVIIALAIWVLDYSEWADSFRIEKGEKSNNLPQSWMIYVLPLLKVTFIITIPAIIARAVIRFGKKWLKKPIMNKI